MPVKASVVVALCCLLAGGTAAAESFEELAASASSLESPLAKAAMLWPLVEECQHHTNELSRRRCVEVRKARHREISRTTHLWQEQGTVGAAKWNKAAKSVKIWVESCMACNEGIEISGAKYAISGPGKVTSTKAGLAGRKLGETTRVITNTKAAKQWVTEVLPRLVTQRVIRVPIGAKRWQAGDRTGFTVDIVGYRVYDPCDGAVVISSPASGAVAARPELCPKAPADR